MFEIFNDLFEFLYLCLRTRTINQTLAKKNVKSLRRSQLNLLNTERRNNMQPFHVNYKSL